MKKFKNLKVGTKLILMSVSILTIILAAAFVFVIEFTVNNTKDSVSKHVNAIADKSSELISADLEDSLDLAQDVAEEIKGFDSMDNDYKRIYSDSFMKNFLEENKHLNGVWACFEANAFDGLDVNYKNKDTSDATGRYISHFSWVDGKVQQFALVDYETPGAGDYYMIAKRTGEETVINPYEYEVGGKKVLLTTLAVPIKNDNGDVIGVVGVDVALANLQRLDYDKGGYKTAYMSIVSNDGTTVSHPNTEAIGVNLSELDVNNKEEVLAAIKNGDSIQVTSKSVMTGNKVDLMFKPVQIGKTTTPWSVAFATEEQETMAACNQMRTTLMLILAGILVIVILVMYLITKRFISKPINATAKFARELASGNLDAEIEITSEDEIGQLKNTLDKEVRQAFKEIEHARAIADKQSAYQEEQVEKLVVNLERLAKGELFCDMEVSEADEDTQEIYELFSNISNNLHKSINTINGYIHEIDDTLGELSRANFVIRIETEYKGDFVTLKESINSIIDSLDRTMSTINVAAEQVSSGSAQVSDGSQEISQGATEQASSIEELSASITQMAAQIKQNAANASVSTDLAAKSIDMANDGNDKMKRMLESMDEINEASSSISKIIKVIDDIAFQTNILALNAAVEAARAGTHGKGFAVVAEEVRNLAARSANAASETTAMIEGSIKKVEAGTSIANDTADALSTIVKGTEESAELLNQIAVASNEQATGIAQINKGIEQLSQVVQTNSATAEEAAAASEELSSQAEILKTMISKFKLSSNVQEEMAPESELEDVEEVVEESGDEPDDARPKIVLNDDEFGKY